MRGYNQGHEDLDEYEDFDGEEYGDEDEEMEEAAAVEEEEEDPRKQQEVKDYLGLRQKFKEQFRKKMTKENGSGVGSSQDKKKKSSLEKFGSFFGPSTPVIADRVIQESKSLLETRHLAPKASNSQTDSKRVIPSSTSGQKNRVSDKPAQNQVQLKSKVEMIKDTRDYSFLLSDDSEVPRPAKDPSRPSGSIRQSDARSAQVPAKSRESLVQSSRQGRHEGRTVSVSSQARPSHMQPPQKSIRPNPASLDSKRQLDSKKQLQPNKQLGSSNGSGAGRPGATKALPPKKPASSIEKRAPASTTSRTVPFALVEKRAPTASVEKKAVVSSMEKKGAPISSRNTMHNGQRPPATNLHASGPKQHVEHRAKVQPKQTLQASKPQMTKHQKQISSRPNVERDHHQKRPKPARQSLDDDDAEAMAELRKMLGGYHGRRHDFSDDDDDDDLSDMEVGFDTIMKEEKRSARIARLEDEEELRKIEEEERLERLRKKRKMSQQR